MNRFLKALKIGYQVLKIAEAGGVQLPTVKGLPLSVVQQAAEAGGKVIVDYHNAQHPR